MSSKNSPIEIQFSFDVFINSSNTINFSVIEFKAFEMISSPFEVKLSLAKDEEVNFDDVIYKEAVLTIFLDIMPDRFFHGILKQFKYIGTRGRFYLYEASLVPFLWLFSLEQDCRIFQKKDQNNNNIEDIVSQVLREGQMNTNHVEFRTSNDYQSREYCVQYRETDFNFISRLIEEEGIFYFFEHWYDKHILIFGDSSTCYQSIPRYTDSEEEGNEGGENLARVTYHPSNGKISEINTVYKFNYCRQIHSGKITLKDYKYERPSLPLTFPESFAKYSNLEIYDYPGKFSVGLEDVEDRGRRLAQIRLQEATLFRDKASGESICPRFESGFVFSLNGNDDFFNNNYLIVRVLHKGAQPQVLEESQETNQGTSYINEFVCIPYRLENSDIIFRPERKTPKPIVYGAQTATVVGPSGKKSWTDEESQPNEKVPYGMVKVKFHWDRDPQKNDHSSCWIRVAYPYAGANHGMQFTPLIGDEVLVNFLEGDPDRPVIVGSLFKGDHKALVQQSEMIKSSIVTPYQHTISLDDKNANIMISTGAGYSCKMSDGEKLIHVSTPKGRFMSIDDTVEEVRLNTEHGSYLSLHDPSKTIKLETEEANFLKMEPGKITLKSTGGQELIFEDNGNISKIKNNNGHCVKIQSGSPNILISDSSLEHKIQVGPSSINVFSDTGTMTIQTKDGDLVVRALGQTLKLEGAGGRITIDDSGIHVDAGSKNIEVKGVGGTITLDSSGIHVDAGGNNVEVKGSSIRLNC